MNGAGVGIALVAGCAGGIQIAVSGQLGARVGTVAAFAFSVTVSLVVAIVALAAARAFSGYGDVFHQPWWLWTGGALGAVVVLAITYAGPRLGTLATIGLIISAQLATGAVIDRFGFFGVERFGLHWPRLFGLVLLAGGAALVLRR